MSAKLERIYWLEFLRHRLLAPIAYDRRHNGYYLTDDSFELPSYWFNPPALLFLAAACTTTWATCTCWATAISAGRPGWAKFQGKKTIFVTS